MTKINDPNQSKFKTKHSHLSYLEDMCAAADIDGAAVDAENSDAGLEMWLLMCEAATE